MTLITVLDLVAGTPSAPLTVVNTNGGNAPIPDGNISWIYDSPGLTGNLIVTPDPGGTFFTFQASSPIAGDSMVHAHYSAAGISVNGPPLTLRISAPVALGYSM